MATTIYGYGYDSVNIHAIPKSIEDGSVISFYLYGDFAVASVLTVQKQFGSKVHYNPIDVNGRRANFARTVDVETGNVKPETLEEYITEWNAQSPYYANGGRCEVYCNRSTIPAVRAGTGKYILGRDYALWVATGDGTIATSETLDLRYNGSIIKNAVNMCQNRWLHGYDESVILLPDMVWA
jgi:hypothetical protein